MKIILLLIFSASMGISNYLSRVYQAVYLGGSHQVMINNNTRDDSAGVKPLTPDSKVIVTTNKVFNIESTSATCYYTFRVESGKTTGNGICVAKVINPTIDGIIFEGHTNGPDCNVDITGLSPGVTFHVRAYVKTGDDKVWYGNELSFITPRKK